MYNDLFVMMMYTETPIGCAGPYEKSKLTCNITWLATNVKECQTSQATKANSCGVTYQALTIAGFEKNNGEPDRESPVLNVDGDKSIPYMGSFLPASFPEHSFWDGYTLPDIKVSFI